MSFGDVSKIKVKGKGTVCYNQKDGVIGRIEDVNYVPDLKTNILILGQLAAKGFSTIIEDQTLHLKDKQGNLIARVQMEKNRTYKLDLENIRKKCLQENVEGRASTWHPRSGGTFYKN